MDCTIRRYYNCKSNDLFSQFANVNNHECMFSLDNRWSCPMAANASWQHCYPQITPIVTPSYDLSEQVELPPLSSPPRKENDTPSPFKFYMKTPTLPATRGIYKEFTLRDSIYQTDRSIPQECRLYWRLIGNTVAADYCLQYNLYGVTYLW
jgi:hypothetical protein